MLTIQRFFRDEAAATAIEYSLVAAGIAVAIVTAVKGLGTTLNTSYSNVQSALR
jgi:pilus assembly protein Flp/PilA